MKHTPPYYTVSLSFLTHQSPLSNVCLRYALGYGLNKKKLCRILNHKNNNFIPAGSFVPKGLLGYHPKVGLPMNLELARMYLKKASLDLKTLKLDYFFEEHKSAHWFKEQIESHLGIPVYLHKMDSFYHRAFLDPQYHAVVEHKWLMQYPDPDSYLSLFLTYSCLKDLCKGSEHLDKKILQARNETKRSRRAELYFELQRWILERQALVIPLYYGKVSSHEEV